MFLRASVNSKAAPINFPLDLVELESLCASHFADKIEDCLLKMVTPSGCSKKYLLDFAVMELA